MTTNIINIITISYFRCGPEIRRYVKKEDYQTFITDNILIKMKGVQKVNKINK